MITTNIFNMTETHKIIDQKGCFSVLEYTKDLSVIPEYASVAYFASKMNIRKKQLIATLNENIGVYAQAKAMQIMMGDVALSTNVKGAGDLLKKFVGSRVTDETTIKPLYYGEGTLILEPTYKYILLLDLSEWNDSVMIQDGTFLACESTAELAVKARANISSAVLGNEGLFNTAIFGSGIVAIESPVPSDEIIVVNLQDDVIKLDGNQAIIWSAGLDFNVERTAKTLVGSFASGEGLVNVYRGTGQIWIAPIFKNPGISVPEVPRSVI